MSLLAPPLNVRVLTTLAEEAHAPNDLRRAIGSPPQTTMRGHLRDLIRIGILKRCQRHGSFEYALGDPGRDLLDLAELAQLWLEDSPDGPIALGDAAAKNALKALVNGWSAGIVRALAAHPLSLNELNKLISGLNYPSLERRVGAMRFTGQIEPAPGDGKETPYRITGWLREAMAPLAASARWERRHRPIETTPIGRIDVEAAFLLVVPAMRVSPDLSGTCRLAVEVRGAGEGEPGMAGVLVRVDEGQVVSCVSRLQGGADGWVLGTARAWIDAVTDRRFEGLEIGGDCFLARELLEALHAAPLQLKQRL